MAIPKVLGRIRTVPEIKHYSGRKFNMSRLNLVCNGMMLFNEAGAYIQIVIPTIEGHVRKFCVDPKPAKDNLVDLPAGCYQLNVPSTSTAPLRDLLDGSEYVVLDGNKVAFSEDIARPTSAIVTVPKPDVVRLYRASEPTSVPAMLGNCSNVVVRTPSVANDIVVLSYTRIPPATKVSLTAIGKESQSLASATTTSGPIPVTITWVLYSNEKTPFSFLREPVELSGAEFAEAVAPQKHPTRLNDFLTLTGRGASQRTSGPMNTTLDLSGIGKMDGPPTNTPIGLTSRQLLLFHELPDSNSAGATIPHQVSGEAGCSGAARAT
jgi:hypothetical protein